jgi:secreted Zn-dependent insulinase-like peptidase
LLELPHQAGINVREQILAFYNKFYSANVMKLVVCGEDSLEDLEKWVKASFSAIVNKQIPVPSYASFGAPVGVKAEMKPLLTRIVPIRDIHSLHLSWMIPSILGKHHQKPADYVASLLGHESEGSVLSDVRTRCHCCLHSCFKN